MEVFKRKHSEIIALYKLESELNDLYVEGNMDKVFIESFLKNKKCNKKVFPIEIVDFSGLNIDYFENFDPTSNKNKVAILSKLISGNIQNSKVKCLIDKDFDDYIKSISNGVLLRTDFSCLESYLFCEEVLEKFLAIAINNFPFSASHILLQLSKALKPLFCIRLMREIWYNSAQLVAIENNVSIEKQTGKINFDEMNYLQKFIDKNNLGIQKVLVIDRYNELMAKLSSDIRHYINGHDFLDIFFLYVNKIKNTLKYKEENFGRVLYLAVESHMIASYPLFKKIIS